MANGLAIATPVAILGPQSNLLSGATLDAVPGSEAFAVLAGPDAAVRGALVVDPDTGFGTLAGARAPSHDGQWFERIHVIPRKKDLLFILTDQQFDVEVWNAFSAAAKVLTAVTVTDPGLEVVHGSLPQHFPASSSTVYTVIAHRQGDAILDEKIVFVFTGIPTSGTDVTITGQRVVVFPIQADSGQTLRERVAFLTDILTARDWNEQRIQHREVALRGMTYAIVCLDDRTAQHANALLFGWKRLVFGVPFWQYASPLGSALSLGGMVITADVASVPYEVGGLALIWRDAFTFEVVTIDSFNATSLTLLAGVGAAWAAAGTYVMPLGLGRLPDKQAFGWEDLRVGGATLEFELEAVGA